MAWAQAACGLAKPALPITALRLSTATLTLLDQLGIERIDQLTALPRDEVAERFGPEVGLRLDQLTGRVAEVIAPLHPAPDAAASWAFDDPVERHDIVVKVLDRLLERLQAILENRHIGTRLVECVFELDGAEPQRFECSLSRPARTASYLRPLLHLKLEQVRVAAPIRAMSVRAVVLERITDEQPNLFDAGSDAAVAQLLDSLTSRLGKDAVTTPRFVADPQPELACRFDPCLAPAENRPHENSTAGTHRPVRLFARPTAIQVVALVPDGAPQRLCFAGADRVVNRCQGPERIETGWWRGDDVQRDYYLVETTDGTRWWIFQRIDDGRWFLHGCFD
jgi:protein ImuB